MSNPDFGTLVAAVVRAGFVDLLNGRRQYTVFAPTNAAFDALASALGYSSGLELVEKLTTGRISGGRLLLIALIDETAVVERILRHLHLPTEVPTPRPGRAPPLVVSPLVEPAALEPDSGPPDAAPCH